MSRFRHVAQGTDRSRISYWRSRDISCCQRRAVAKGCVSETSGVPRTAAFFLDCSPVAHCCNPGQSALFRFHHAQRIRLLPWLLLVLFPQRTPVSIPEHPLSAGLQHRPEACVLVSAIGLAVSLERFPARDLTASLSRYRSRGSPPAARLMLGGVRDVLLYVLD